MFYYILCSLNKRSNQKLLTIKNFITMFYAVTATFEVCPKLTAIDFYQVAKMTLKKQIKIEASSSEQATNIMDKNIREFCIHKNYTLNKIHIEIKSDIMPYHNGHNSVLVDKLNELWDEEINRFNINLIVKSLYIMYSEECYDKNICRLPFSDPHYGDFLWKFLTHVCDDLDLETIIQFVTHKKVELS